MKEEYKKGAFDLKVIKTEIVHFKIIISINTKKLYPYIPLLSISTHQV